jgi:hypothetical protein
VISSVSEKILVRSRGQYDLMIGNLECSTVNNGIKYELDDRIKWFSLDYALDGRAQLSEDFAVRRKYEVDLTTSSKPKPPFVKRNINQSIIKFN